MRNLEEILSPLVDSLKYVGVEYPTIELPPAVKTFLGLDELETALGLNLDGLFRARWNGERFYFAKPGVWAIEGAPSILFGFNQEGHQSAPLNPAGYLIKTGFGHTYEVGGLVIPVWVQSEVLLDSAVVPIASLPAVLKQLDVSGGASKGLPRLIDTILACGEPNKNVVLNLTEAPSDIPGSKFPRMKVTGGLNVDELKDCTWQVPGRLGTRLMCDYLMGVTTHELTVKQSKNGPYIDVA